MEASEKKLEKLKALLMDYTYPEKVCKNMLREIADLMSWAITAYITKGLSPLEVSEILGNPIISVGEIGDDSLNWLYPCLPPDDHLGEMALEEKWYWDLLFISGKLIRMEKKKWRMIE